MGYLLVADLVIILHMAFVLFVLFGGLVTVKWPRAVWFHLPAAAWGALVEFTGWPCPLSSLEYGLRLQAGESGYEGDFVSRWLLPILYPDFLTTGTQLVLGSLVLAVNATVYAWVWRKRLTNPL